MPGSGKTTIAKLLASHTKKQFIDSDALIENFAKKSLQDIANQEGYQCLRNLEEKILCGLELSDSILATGGSAIYSSIAMQHLKSQAYIIYLQCSLLSLKERITNFTTRGLAKPKNQSLEELYSERESLYEKYADFKVGNEAISEQELLKIILSHPEFAKQL